MNKQEHFLYDPDDASLSPQQIRQKYDQEQHSDFDEDLERSHRAADLPMWRVTYLAAFPGMTAMPSHQGDGDHQRAGIDRSVIMPNSKQYLIDEKIRGRNKKTGRVYDDVALEYLANVEANRQGWVCKPLLADFIAYGIAPLGICYLLPVLQLQQAWTLHNADWFERFPIANASTKTERGVYHSKSLCVDPATLYKAIGGCLRVRFSPFEYDPADYR